MTPGQINIAIAEHLGWQVKQKFSGLSYLYSPKGAQRGGGWHSPSEAWRQQLHSSPKIPNYSGDLNAMREAEQALWAEDWSLRSQFVDHLARIISPIHGYHKQEGIDLLDATAAQRSEALVRTIGKWKEQP